MKPKRREELIKQYDRILEERKLAPSTSRTYSWQVGTFIDFCNKDPEHIPATKIEDYLRGLLKRRVSRPFFLQACAAIDLLYRQLYNSNKVRNILPTVQEKTRTDSRAPSK
jgi:site-specific recombinase XerD